MLQAVWLKPHEGKRSLVSHVVFYMVAELPGAATAKAMSRVRAEGDWKSL